MRLRLSLMSLPGQCFDPMQREMLFYGYILLSVFLMKTKHLMKEF